ncbi:MAG: phospholipase D-like domain-containing protein [Bacteroidales bacterium]|jgi:HKD family nuclease|nr:phospholipase D-like domain-containing protein [Bacteroidales bacterium]
MAAKIQILSNTNYPLSDVLKSELLESTQVKIAVAFLRCTGIDEIYKSLDYALRENNAQIEIIAGLDFKTTDSNALLALKEIETKQKNFKFYCFGDKRDNHNDLVFHPKMYLFETALSRNTKYTSIIGSSNLTGGGLTSNFEVNSIFREDTPKYYSQLEAIYNEIKYTDSVFTPSKDYIFRYGNIKKKIEKTEDMTGKAMQNELQLLKDEEAKLPGTVPSLKKIIIEFIKEQNQKGIQEVLVDTLYKEMPKRIAVQGLKMKMDTINNTIRGELNKHEFNSKHKDGMSLFKRTGKGLYALTEKAENYAGR